MNNIIRQTTAYTIRQTTAYTIRQTTAYIITDLEDGKDIQLSSAHVITELEEDRIRQVALERYNNEQCRYSIMYCLWYIFCRLLMLTAISTLIYYEYCDHPSGSKCKHPL